MIFINSFKNSNGISRASKLVEAAESLNGTKAKLFLVKLMLDKCDVLVLDEPTRNVSPLSNPVIRDVLRRFKGTIISVSHDRKYLEEVIDKLFILSEDGLKEINESTD